MLLKVNFNQFLDDEGDVLELTEQANTVFNFLSKIVLTVSQKLVPQNINQPNIGQPDIKQQHIEVDLKCKNRGHKLSCLGNIEAGYSTGTSSGSDNISIIEWHCDTCEAAGTISHWLGSSWDKQKRIIH